MFLFAYYFTIIVNYLESLLLINLEVLWLTEGAILFCAGQKGVPLHN